MKTKFLAALFGLAAVLALGGCPSMTMTPAQHAAMLENARSRHLQWLAEAKTDLVTSGDQVPVYFDGAPAQGTRATPPEIWKNIFTGTLDAKARLAIVEERPSTTFENLAFTARYHYGVTVSLTVAGQVHLLSGESNVAILTGSAKSERETIERALLSVAKQARVYLNSTQTASVP